MIESSFLVRRKARPFPATTHLHLPPIDFALRSRVARAVAFARLSDQVCQSLWDWQNRAHHRTVSLKPLHVTTPHTGSSAGASLGGLLAPQTKPEIRRGRFCRASRRTRQCCSKNEPMSLPRKDLRLQHSMLGSLVKRMLSLRVCHYQGMYWRNRQDDLRGVPWTPSPQIEVAGGSARIWYMMQAREAVAGLSRLCGAEQ